MKRNILTETWHVLRNKGTGYAKAYRKYRVMYAVSNYTDEGPKFRIRRLP